MKIIAINIAIMLLFVGSAHSETAYDLDNSLDACMYNSLLQRMTFYPSTSLKDSFRVAVDQCNSQYDRLIDLVRNKDESEKAIEAFDRELVMQFIQWYSEGKR